MANSFNKYLLRIDTSSRKIYRHVSYEIRNHLNIYEPERIYPRDGLFFS